MDRCGFAVGKRLCKSTVQAEHQALFHALQNNDYAACEAAIDRHYDYVDAELSKSSK
ncbi:MAG: hypothetical protein ACLTXT_06865 [Ruminococcus callidus]